MADFGEDIAVSLVPDFTRFDEEYRAEVARLQHNPVSIPVAFTVDKTKLKADLEAVARELSRSTEISVRVRLDTTAARAELARLRAEANIAPRGGGGGGGGAGGIGLIGGIAAGGVALAPAAVGGFTGLAAAIGTATLAYKGFQQQAASGTGFGATISGQIDQIKSAFGSLEQVAANAAGPGLVAGLKTLQQAIPGLAPQVKELGSALGSFAGSAGTALVNTLQAASPLLSAFASSLEKAGSGIAAFTASDDFKQFMDNAAKELPTLVDLVGQAAKVFVELANAVTPLVSPLLSVADAIAKIVGAIGHLPGGTGNAILAAGAGALLLGRTGIGAAAGAGAGGGGGGGGIPIIGGLGRAGLGRLGALAAIVGGADLASTGLSHHGFSAGSAAQSIGGGALVGAGIGSIVPGAGTITGGIVGAVAGGVLYLGKEGLSSLSGGKPLPSLKVGTPGLGAQPGNKNTGYGDYIGAPGLGAGPNGMVIVGVNPSTGEPQYAPQGTRQISWDAQGQPQYDQVGGTRVRPISIPYKPLPPSTYSGPNYGLQFPQPQLQAAGIYNAGSTQAINQTLAAAITSSPYRGAYDKDTKSYIGPQSTAAAGLTAADQRFGPAIDAMHQYDDALANVKTAQQDEARTEIAGAQQISAAQHALAQARTNAAHTAIQDAEAIKNAEADVASARQNVADVTHQATESIADAEHSLSMAQRDATDAQKNLNEARKDAARQLQDYSRAAIDSGDSLQSAQLRLQQLQLNQAARTGSLTPEQIFQQQNQLTNKGNTLDLKTAQDQVTDAQIAHNRAVQDNNTAQKKGVEGSDQVVAAKRQVADANYNVAHSEQALADTRHSAAEAEDAANKQLTKSVKTLGDTRRQANWDRAASEDAVKTARQGVTNAETNAEQADNDAHSRTVQAGRDADTMGDNFKYAAGQVGETTGQIRSIDKVIGNGKRSLAMSYTAGDATTVTKDVIDVQKDLYEAVLIAGGKTPAEAKRIADSTIKLPKKPASVPPQTYGSSASAEHGGKAEGGPVYGPGGPTDDKAGLYRLSAGEHVWTAKEVENAGGHKAVEGMRQYYRGMAEGGPVDPHQHATLNINMAGMKLPSLVKAYGNSIIRGMAAAGPDYGAGVIGGPSGFTGLPHNAETIAELLLAGGFNAIATAGVLGNLRWESDFSPTALNASGAYGIAQWLGGRKASLMGYAADRHTSAATLPIQVGYLLQEARARGLFAKMNAEPNAALAANLWNDQFETSGDTSNRRPGSATQYYANYSAPAANASYTTGPIPSHEVPAHWSPSDGYASKYIGHHNPPWPAPVHGHVSANTAAAANYVRHRWGIPVDPSAGRQGDPFDHPWGKANDNMINGLPHDKGVATGWQIANWFAANPRVFGTKYILWNHRANQGAHWEPLDIADQHTSHVHTSFYDQGGMLNPGATLAVNQSTKPEAVLTEPQWRLLRQIARNGGGRAVQHIEHQHIHTPQAADMLVRMLQFATLAAGGGGL